jgi:hypothetical protein
MKPSFLKKNWYFLVPAVLVALPVLVIVMYMGIYGYGWEDAYQSARHFGDSKTNYAMKYSDGGLASIVPGMEGRAVYERIGNPLEGHIVGGKPGTNWIYSTPAHEHNSYHERAVIFDLNGAGGVPRVKQVVKRFHVAK